MALRLGLIGRGPWGRNIERTLSSFPDVAVVPIGRGEAPPAGLDGVLISTPDATHAGLALSYIERGVTTFIEKPMVTTVADAERIRDAAALSGAVVFVGHIFLYNPAFIALLNLLPALGAVRQVVCDGMNDGKRTDTSVIWDWLPHELAMARAIFGRDPDSAECWNLSGENPAQAAVSKFMFGAASLLCVSSWLSPVKRKHMTVACEKGTIVFDDKAARRLSLVANNGAVAYPAYDGEMPLTRELRVFVETVRSGRPDMPHVEIGSAIVRIIAAAEQSMNDGGRVVPLA